MVPVPEIFVKGGDVSCKKILFTKFGSKSLRDDVVTKMRQQLEDGIEEVWVKPDLPVRTRAINGFLLGLKRLLVLWGHNKSHVQVDLDISVLVAGQDEAVKIVDSKLEWHHAWEAWGVYGRCNC